jgi:poly-gamma-glutamate synthesis protein (capsule biosynthesis protein)
LRRDANGILDAADVARITAAIAEAAAHADIVLAYHYNHFFEEGGRRTPQWQRQFARQCVDAGASLYISHGAPRLHGIELYRGRPLFYDLGNLGFRRHEEGFYDDAVWRASSPGFAGSGPQMTLTRSS